MEKILIELGLKMLLKYAKEKYQFLMDLAVNKDNMVPGAKPCLAGYMPILILWEKRIVIIDTLLKGNKIDDIGCMKDLEGYWNTEDSTCLLTKL